MWGGARDNLVKDNEAFLNERGVFIDYIGSPDTEESGNTVRENLIRDNFGQGVYLGETARENFIGPGNEIRGNLRGIQLFASDRNEIFGNEIYGNPERGIDIVGSNDNEISGNDITGGSQEDGIVLSTGVGGAAAGRHSENNVFRGNRITGHPGYGVHATGDMANYADAAYNWWGDAGGPSHASNPGGSGDAVSDNVDFIPWYIDEEMTTVSGEAAEVWVGPGQPFTSIQAAVNVVASGGTVYVKAGTYNENIVIDRELTLESEDGPDVTVIDGGGADTVVMITADGVVVKGFTVRNSSLAGAAGIAVVSAEGCEISGNVVHGNDYGIALVENASQNVVDFNEVHSNNTGVYINYLFDNTSSSAWNTVSNNNIYDNVGQGVYLGETARENFIGPGNDIRGNLRGILLYASDGNEIFGNEIYGNSERGIAIIGSHDNEISGNDITGGSQEDGIVLSTGVGGAAAGRHSENNVFRHNRITGHPGYGVHATGDMANYADAAYNWWGDAGGPSHASNPGGSGDAVSDNVDFIPWYIDEEMTVHSAQPAEVWVGPGQPFASIQAAVNVVAPGGTVYVKAGTYNENIVIDRELTLESEDGPDVTVIDGGGADTVVMVTADGVVVKGFTVGNSALGEYGGIVIAGVSGCEVSYNVVEDNSFGIAVLATASNADNNVIKENIIRDNDLPFMLHPDHDAYGIFIDKYEGSPFGAVGNRIEGNEISGSKTGVYLGEAATQTYVYDNDIFNNYIQGAQLFWSDNNEFISNRIFNNGAQGAVGDTLNSAGVRLAGARDNVFNHNEVYNQAGTGGVQVKGFRLFDSRERSPSGNVINENRIYGHKEGGSPFLYGIDNRGYEFTAPVPVDASYNWWGAAGGPEHATNPGGAGDRVSDDVDFIPWYVDEEMTAVSTHPDVEIATLAAADVEETSAVLRGELTSLKDLDEVDVFFYFGESGGEMEKTESETVSETGGFEKMVQGLEPGTEYKFRAAARWVENGEDKEAQGEILTFTTSEPEPEPDPDADVAVSTLEASGVGRTSATLRGEITKMDYIAEVEVRFFWREAGKSGQHTEAEFMTSAGTFSKQITGLEPETRYDFRAEASWTYDGVENTLKGKVKSFVTDEPEDPAPDPAPDPDPDPDAPLPPPPPPPENFNANPAPDNFLNVNLSWNEHPGASYYNLYVSTAPGAAGADAQEAGGLRFTLIAQLPSYRRSHTHAGLTAGVKYYYVITCVNAHGTESVVSSNIAWVLAGTAETGRLDPVPWSAARVTDRHIHPDSSSPCFIATAAYGSHFSLEVASLRSFRDGFLLENSAGRLFTAAYYRISPAFADVVAESVFLRGVARLHIAPFVRAYDVFLN